MASFIDELGRRYNGLTELKTTNSISGEKSLTGIVYTNGDLIHNAGRGWIVEHEYERYVITYARPTDNGAQVELEFDAVHEFFYDLSKSVVYGELNGSNTMRAYLDFIFSAIDYEYFLDVQVNAFEKESFGFKNRLTLFKDIIKTAEVEFIVTGRVVRIMDKVGRDLTTTVRKGFNLQELKIEKNVNDFITFKRGYGAYVDEEDHDQGRMFVEYFSPLMLVYGRLDGEPVMDERYTNEQSLLDRIKADVENSYSISVQLTMEDLTKAGYIYEQPQQGDYIMAINEDLNFAKRIRIISYESEYDTTGNLIDHIVTCDSTGIVQAGGNRDRQELINQIDRIDRTIETVQVQANGKNKIFRGIVEPTTGLIRNDIWYKPVGNGETELYNYDGAQWRIEKLSAGLLAGTLDVLNGDVNLINVNVDSIVGRISEFVQSNWNGATGGSVQATGDGIVSTASDGAQLLIQNGLAMTRQPNGATIGSIGYDQIGISPRYTIQTSWGSHFQIKQKYENDDGDLEDRVTLLMNARETQLDTDSFQLIGDRQSIGFDWKHYISGTDADALAVTGRQEVMLRASETTVFAVTSDGVNNTAIVHADLNMGGNTIINESDIRLKANVEESKIDALREIERMQFIEFEWDKTKNVNEQKPDGKHFGIIAQYSPFLQTKAVNSESYLSVDMGKQVHLNSKAIQELAQKVEALQNE